MTNPKGNPATLKPYRPKWRSGKTQVIRVPIALADEVLRLAQQLDRSEPLSIDLSIKFDRATKEVLADPSVTRNGRDAGSVRRAIAALKARLE